MKVPIFWIKEYIKLDVSLEELKEKLIMCGLEVEGIEDFNDEKVFNLKITSNRGDCLSIIGVAREIQAILGNKLRMPDFSIKEDDENISNLIKVEISEESLCPRYSCRIMKDVEVKESPSWLKNKIESAGLRCVNNVVDATNFVLLELGQPLHAFDYDLIEGKEIIVRCAKEGEKIITLDGRIRELTSSNLVIADKIKPIAIAGVIGGLNTEVKEKTKNILLESAHFNALSVRRTAKNLGLSTEASYRFERGVDPAGTVKALDRVCRIIQEIGGGKIVKNYIDTCTMKIQPKEILLRSDRCNKILGTNLSLENLKKLLNRLELNSILKNDNLIVSVPTFRMDLNKEIDLIEEIARVYGYEKIEEKLPEGKIFPGKKPKNIFWEEKAKEILIKIGLKEVMSYSLINPKVFEKILLGEDNLRKIIPIKNPMSEEHSVLRTTLLPSFIEIVKRNMSFNIEDINIFEFGKIYYLEENLMKEIRTLACCISRNLLKKSWNLKENLKADIFYLKGIFSLLFKELGINNYEIKKASYPFFYEDSGGEIYINTEKIGFFGEIQDEVKRNFEIDVDLFYFEIDFDKILNDVKEEKFYTPLPKYPEIKRDISLLVKEEVTNEEITKIIKGQGGHLLKRLELFDVYRGKQIPEGFKSLAYSLIYQNENRTLSSEEVEIIQENIKKELKNLKIKLREKKND